MKGLILKDFYNLKGYFRQYVIIFGVMLVVAYMMKSLSFVAIYVELLSGMMVITSISADEAVHFDRFALTMPVSEIKLVKAKYVLFSVMLTGGILLSIFLWIVQEFLASGQWSSLNENIATAITLGAVFFVTYSITLPIVFKLGAEKGRYVYMVVLAVLGAAIIGGINLSNAFGAGKAMISGEPSVLQLAIAAVLISVAAVLISCRISVRVIKKKEWQ